MAQLTAEQLQTALRTEWQRVKTTAGATNIRLVFLFRNGQTKFVKLNPDGTWRVKPTQTDDGLVRLEWLDTSESRVISDDGTTVTVADNAYTETIDPGEVMAWQYAYDLTTSKTRDIPSDN